MRFTTLGPRRCRYALLGLVLSCGAPLGMVVVRAANARSPGLAWLSGELIDQAPAYLYLTFSTALAFLLFGYALGRQADRLARLSTTDPLTGLGNRRALEDSLESEFRRAERYGQALSLLLVDIDGLKSFNDRHGHRVGDFAIQQTAAAIRKGLRSVDLAVRWGGDEFLVLAPNTTEGEGVMVAERIRDLAARTPTGVPERLTLSVGVATYDPATGAGRLDQLDQLVRAADAALYEAKLGGRNRVASA